MPWRVGSCPSPQARTSLGGWTRDESDFGRLGNVRLSADFRLGPDGAPQEGVRVEDLSPKVVEGKDPVRIVTKRSGDLSFELETVGVGANVSTEMSREAQVYFPVVRGAAVVSGLAVWDFEPLPGGPLYVDRDLRLLVSGPLASPGGLHVEFRVQAKVSLDGLQGLVPLIGRRSVDLTAGQRLD